MGFEAGRRRGGFWDDSLKLDAFLKNHNFNFTCKDEREFENSFASALISRQNEFENKIISQLDQEATVKSVYCFGKNHRPDITLGTDGIAIEIKYIKDSPDNFKHSLGQTILYRLRYRFSFLVLILAKNYQELYEKLVNGEEKDLEDLFKYLSKELNIFSYVAPSFTLRNNIKKIFSVNDFSEPVQQ